MYRKIVLVFLLLTISIPLITLAVEITYPALPGVVAPQDVAREVDNGGDFISFFINYLFNFLLIISLSIAALVTAYGGFLFISSTDNPEKRQSAKNWIMSAMQGTLIVLISYTLMLALDANFVLFRQIDLEGGRAPGDGVDVRWEIRNIYFQAPMGLLIEDAVLNENGKNKIYDVYYATVAAETTADQIKDASIELLEIIESCPEGEPCCGETAMTSTNTKKKPKDVPDWVKLWDVPNNQTEYKDLPPSEVKDFRRETPSETLLSEEERNSIEEDFHCFPGENSSRTRYSDKYGFIQYSDGSSRNHHGVDIPIESGSRVFATHPGKVVFSGWGGGAGNMVSILYTNSSTGKHYVMHYAHFSEKSSLKRGDTVSGGQQIGLGGSTGNSTGPHIHYEVREVKPGVSIDMIGLNGRNLYDGAGSSIDPIANGFLPQTPGQFCSSTSLFGNYFLASLTFFVAPNMGFFSLLLTALIFVIALFIIKSYLSKKKHPLSLISLLLIFSLILTSFPLSLKKNENTNNQNILYVNASDSLLLAQASSGSNLPVPMSHYARVWFDIWNAKPPAPSSLKLLPAATPLIATSTATIVAIGAVGVVSVASLIALNYWLENDPNVTRKDYGFGSSGRRGAPQANKQIDKTTDDEDDPPTPVGNETPDDEDDPPVQTSSNASCVIKTSKCEDSGMENSAWSKCNPVPGQTPVGQFCCCPKEEDWPYDAEPGCVDDYPKKRSDGMCPDPLPDGCKHVHFGGVDKIPEDYRNKVFCCCKDDVDDRCPDGLEEGGAPPCEDGCSVETDPVTGEEFCCCPEEENRCPDGLEEGGAPPCEDGCSVETDPVRGEEFCCCPEEEMECSPGERSCEGDSVVFCDENGQWQEEENCKDNGENWICEDGQCVMLDPCPSCPEIKPPVLAKIAELEGYMNQLNEDLITLVATKEPLKEDLYNFYKIMMLKSLGYQNVISYNDFLIDRLYYETTEVAVVTDGEVVQIGPYKWDWSQWVFNITYPVQVGGEIREENDPATFYLKKPHSDKAIEDALSLAQQAKQSDIQTLGPGVTTNLSTSLQLPTTIKKLISSLEDAIRVNIIKIIESITVQASNAVLTDCLQEKVGGTTTTAQECERMIGLCIQENDIEPDSLNLSEAEIRGLFSICGVDTEEDMSDTLSCGMEIPIGEAMELVWDHLMEILETIDEYEAKGKELIEKQEIMNELSRPCDCPCEGDDGCEMGGNCGGCKLTCDLDAIRKAHEEVLKTREELREIGEHLYLLTDGFYMTPTENLCHYLNEDVRTGSEKDSCSGGGSIMITMNELVTRKLNYSRTSFDDCLLRPEDVADVLTGSSASQRLIFSPLAEQADIPRYIKGGGSGTSTSIFNWFCCSQSAQ